ncbi:MAG: GntR family transcriptional regulator [Prolixibacteraceae bacterium]
MRNVIHINPKSSKPKYRQIIESVYDAIERKSLAKNDKIPSINKICTEFNLSRDTVMAAFNELKAKGVLVSQPGKGYYVATTECRRKENVFMLFDEFNAFKEDLYNSLIHTLQDKANVEIFFHYFNFKLFRNLILDSIGNYTTYILMPATFSNTAHLLQKLPKEKVFLLDRQTEDLNDYPLVYQDFENDFYDALKEGEEQLKKYRKLIFINQEGKEPTERVAGFKRFCSEFNFKYRVLKSLDGTKPELYEAYFLTSDRDLVDLVKMAKRYKLKLGKKFGIVSFNDTMLKEVVAGGITTISTDFVKMGKTLGNMVLTGKTGRHRNPSRLIVRKSL